MKSFIAGALVALLCVGAASQDDGEEKKDEPKPWALFDLAKVDEERVEKKANWQEFFRNDTMYLGLYEVKSDQVDRQEPHSFDEIYYVLEGNGLLRVEDEDVRVGKGAVVFVAANAKHRFHSLEEDLKLLVFFSREKPKPWQEGR